MNMPRYLTISYGTSRGAQTYGYRLVTLREKGKKKARTCGGGYDMRGTVFGEWLEKEYQSRLMENAEKMASTWTKASGYKSDNANRAKWYGGTFYPEGSSENKQPQVSLDGACGFSCMTGIAKSIGLNVTLVRDGKNSDVLVITDTRAG